MKSLRRSLLLLTICVVSFLQLRAQVVQWPLAGQGAANLRSQPAESFLGAGNASTLVPKWIFTTGGDVSATPTVSATAVFVPDWAGNLFAINLATGQTLWSHLISDYDGSAGAVTRVSPALYNNTLIIGDSEQTGSAHNGANVIAIDQQTGALLWITQIESHPAAIITGSPVVVGNVVYEGVSSAEEGLAEEQGYACCTFRGSIVALNAHTGKILWKQYTVPDNHGVSGKYSGGPIWQPPAVDTSRNLLYVGTGNNYTVPPNVETCRQEHPRDNACDAVSDHFDSALALDLTTGEIKWYRRLYGYDAWNWDCIVQGPYCPDPEGPDFDLPGSGPNLLGNIVGFAQKSGVYWALDADTGEPIWSLSVGPGGSVGGIEWGTASDGTNIYIASANSDNVSYTLLSGQQVTWGFWNAVNAETGSILWQIPDPTQGTIEPGAVSVANGVVYAGSYDATVMSTLSTAERARFCGVTPLVVR